MYNTSCGGKADLTRILKKNRPQLLNDHLQARWRWANNCSESRYTYYSLFSEEDLKPSVPNDKQIIPAVIPGYMKSWQNVFAGKEGHLMCLWRFAVSMSLKLVLVWRFLSALCVSSAQQDYSSAPLRTVAQVEKHKMIERKWNFLSIILFSTNPQNIRQVSWSALEQNVFDWGLRIFLSDVISEVVLGPFWLMLPRSKC